MKIAIINGPNLNLLGKREVSIYGKQDFESFYQQLREEFPDHEISYFQSNSEGAIVDQIHNVGFDFDGIVLNPAAYTHTSVAIPDAISGVTADVVEVHISNVFKREEFRSHSYVSPVSLGIISGLGLDGYRLAIQHLINR
ncbi:MAG: type II 3-dehydroquinate dehydratase [Cyclobacteriaceae bacterium]